MPDVRGRLLVTRAALSSEARSLGLSDEGTSAELEQRIAERKDELAAAVEMVGDIEIHVGKWAGKSNYLCPECRFASLSKRKTVLHVAEVHLLGEGQG